MKKRKRSVNCGSNAVYITARNCEKLADKINNNENSSQNLADWGTGDKGDIVECERIVC